MDLTKEGGPLLTLEDAMVEEAEEELRPNGKEEQDAEDLVGGVEVLASVVFGAQVHSAGTSHGREDETDELNPGVDFDSVHDAKEERADGPEHEVGETHHEGVNVRRWVTVALGKLKGGARDGVRRVGGIIRQRHARRVGVGGGRLRHVHGELAIEVMILEAGGEGVGLQVGAAWHTRSDRENEGLGSRGHIERAAGAAHIPRGCVVAHRVHAHLAIGDPAERSGVCVLVRVRQAIPIDQIAGDIFVVAWLAVVGGHPWAHRHAGAVAAGVRNEIQAVLHALADANAHPRIAGWRRHVEVDVFIRCIDGEGEDELLFARRLGVGKDGGGIAGACREDEGGEDREQGENEKRKLHAG